MFSHICQIFNVSFKNNFNVKNAFEKSIMHTLKLLTSYPQLRSKAKHAPNFTNHECEYKRHETYFLGKFYCVEELLHQNLIF